MQTCRNMKTTSSISLHLPLYLRQRLLVFFTIYPRMASPGASMDSPMSASHFGVWGLDGIHYHIQPYRSAGVPSSGPQICTACAVLIEPFPQLPCNWNPSVNVNYFKVEIKDQHKSQPWWLTPIIAALERLKQMDCHGFQASLGYRIRHCLKILGELINCNYDNSEIITLFSALK